MRITTSSHGYRYGRRRARLGRRAVLLSLALGVLVLFAFPGWASAAGPVPVWSIAAGTPIPVQTGRIGPPVTRVSPGGLAMFVFTVKNTGSAPTDGAGALDVTLPAGITGVSLTSDFPQGDPLTTWTCSNPSGASSIHCDLGAVLNPGDQAERVFLTVAVASSASGHLGTVAQVSAGGAGAPASVAFTTNVSFTPEFSVQSFDGLWANPDGTPDTQAGSHPYAATTSFAFSTTTVTTSSGGVNTLPDGDVKDLQVNLPAGFVGDPTAVPRCTSVQLVTYQCPGGTQVGSLTVAGIALGELTFPVYNMIPPPGEPAQFGVNIRHLVFIDAHVRSGGDYGLTATLSNITTAAPLYGSSLTLWGVPADPSHDAQRVCANRVSPCSSGAPLRAFLTLPGSCSGPQRTTLNADSWGSIGDFTDSSFVNHDNTGAPVGSDGCNQLAFTPSLTAQPDTSSADSPTGLSVDVHVPQAGLQDPNGLAAANLKKAVVTLPAGLSVNPASAGGLAGCSPAQIALSSAAPATCPDASKVGSVEVDTPLLDHPLTGGVFVAAQNDNPFGSLLAIYIAVSDPQTGVVIKLAGHVVPDPVTGQLTATFDSNPQLPFSDFKLDFFGGPRAALATPQACGAFQTTGQMVPWSAVDPGNPLASEVVSVGDAFSITSGAGGGPCVGSLPFAPSFTAGTVSNQANGFSPLSVSFSRVDGEQQLGGVSVTTPPGLLGMLSSVPLCEEPAASQGTCSAGSQIGHTTVSAGVGSSPVVIPQAGQPQAPVFLTGSYKGGPFGLSIVVPAVAGPFNLGNVVVRAAISVDPHTAQVTIVSDPLPTILQGIPLRVRSVGVVVDRPGFIFNPTSCDPLAVTGTITGTQGASAGVSSRFQAANCGELPFSPKFSASTTAKTSRANGASLDAKILIGVQGEANAHVVAVSLPKQLPSRLTTIQKACLDSVFNVNPAACPAASLVGTASAVTPVLPVALSGPAYLVSHGGARFPDLVVVLQGDGVRVDLVGSINISSKGITSSTFASAPDAPINSFELSLPQGPHSILTSNGSLCAKPLIMPTTITAYNNKQIKQSTRIKVTGCPKARKARKHRAKRRAGAKRGRAGKKRG